jgi:hypothetical protein
MSPRSTAPSPPPRPGRPADPAGRPWTWWLGSAGGVFLGAVLLVATWAKAIHPLAFAEQIRIEGLDFLLPAMAVVYLALVLEGAIGMALITNLRRLWVLVPAALLIALLPLPHRPRLVPRGPRAAGRGGRLRLFRDTGGAHPGGGLLAGPLPPGAAAGSRLPRSATGARRFPPLRTALVAGAALAPWC